MGNADNDDQESEADDRANPTISGEDPSTITQVDQDAGFSRAVDTEHLLASEMGQDTIGDPRHEQ